MHVGVHPFIYIHMYMYIRRWTCGVYTSVYMCMYPLLPASCGGCVRVCLGTYVGVCSVDARAESRAARLLENSLYVETWMCSVCMYVRTGDSTSIHQHPSRWSCNKSPARS